MGTSTSGSRRAALSLACALLSALLFSALWPAGRADAAYTIVKFIDGGNRPDLPPGTPFYIFYTPVISGDRVAFLSRNGPPDGVWSGNINTGTVKKLVGLNTPVPHGVGNFSQFFGGGDSSNLRLTIGGGFVAFFATDAENTLGLYVVPVNGGPIKRIVTTNTVAPDGQEFTSLAHASLNGPTVVFQGSTSLHFSGIYRATRNGTGLAKVIDGDTTLDARLPGGGTSPDYYGIYGNPVIGSGQNISFLAGGLFDPSSGPNAIFRSSDLQIRADNVTRLDGRPYSHNRIQQLSAAIGSNGVAFRADQPNKSFVGIFKVRTKSAADAFVTNLDNAPGTNRKFISFGGFGYDDSGLAFTGVRALGTGSEQNVYFTESPGGPIVRVATGQQYFFPMVGDRSISNGRIVFMEQSNFADTVFVAVPVEP